MKVGILTLSLGDNYGGVLQNYALQEALRMEGHQPITISHDYFYPWYVIFIYKIKSFLFGILKRKQKGISDRKSSNHIFIEKNIVHTPPYICLNNNIVKRYEFDAMIVGSDQVWRPRYNPNNLPDFYLRFVKEKSCVKFAYAASFGVDNCEYTSKDIKACLKYVHKLKGISVREKTGASLCEKYFGVTPVLVLDPTLLITKGKYEVLCSSIKPDDRPYILAYVLDDNDSIRAIINSVMKKLEVPVKFIKANGQVTIEDWLSHFRDASLVVTDSFHGTVFSIIFEKDFISVPNIKRGASRFESLLSNFGLMDRLVSNNFEPELILHGINWDKVNKKIESLRKISLSYLREMMS